MFSDMRTKTSDHGCNRAAIHRMLRVALASICLLTSVACGWVETVPSTTGGAGTPTGGTGNTPGNPPPSQPPTTPPPAIAAYSVRWFPSTSTGVVGYELTIEHPPSNSVRTVDIPLSAARRVDNQLRYEVNLETDRDHVLSMRAYDGSSESPPSNAIVVRSTALIASTMTAGPSAARVDEPTTGSTSSLGTGSLATFFEPSAAGAGPSAAGEEPGAANGSDPTASPTGDDAAAGESAFDAGSVVSLALDGSGDHLVGYRAESAAELLDGQGDATLAVWLRPALDDAERRVVFSLADAEAAEFDRIELAIVGGDGLELVMRDAAGRVGYRASFAEALASDVWQHVALVLEPGADVPLALYVDGMPVAGDGVASGMPASPSSAGVLRIGAGSQGDGFSGRVGHAALWARALGEDELVVASVRGHALDLRAGDGGAALAHYWRLGDGEAGFEFDLADTGLAIDLAPSSANVLAVEDAPLPLD